MTAIPDTIAKLIDTFQTNAEHYRSAAYNRSNATDRQIDRLVYDLYGLTEEEIGVVEEGTGH
jgi:hypothetical protein